jgi:hypothetical protein
MPSHASLKTFVDDLRLLPFSERSQQAYWHCVGQLAAPFTFRKGLPSQPRRGIVQPGNAANPPLRSGLATFLFLLGIVITCLSILPQVPWRLPPTNSRILLGQKPSGRRA